MKNMKSYLATGSAIFFTSLFLLAVMGSFSDSYAKGEHGSMKYNATVITKFGSSSPLPDNLDVYFSGPADRPDAVSGLLKEPLLIRISGGLLLWKLKRSASGVT